MFFRLRRWCRPYQIGESYSILFFWFPSLIPTGLFQFCLHRFSLFYNFIYLISRIIKQHIAFIFEEAHGWSPLLSLRKIFSAEPPVQEPELLHGSRMPAGEESGLEAWEDAHGRRVPAQPATIQPKMVQSEPRLLEGVPTRVSRKSRNKSVI
jgi:hypothetical protein